MSDNITINTNKLFAMIVGLVLATGAAGAGAGAALGIKLATPVIAAGAAGPSEAERVALKAEREAFRAEVRDTLTALKEAGRGGPTIEDISQGIQRAFAAMDARSRDKNRKDAEAGEAYLKSLSKGGSK